MLKTNHRMSSHHFQISLTTFFKTVGAISVLLLLAGCVYLNSGTWEDDPKNWSRMYGQDKPPDVTLIHSWYWRSPHWTVEQELFVEIAFNQKILESFLSRGNLKRIKISNGTTIQNFIQSDHLPTWFVPGTLAENEIWTDSETFSLFINNKTGHIYWHDIQL